MLHELRHLASFGDIYTMVIVMPSPHFFIFQLCIWTILFNHVHIDNVVFIWLIALHFPTKKILTCAWRRRMRVIIAQDGRSSGILIHFRHAASSSITADVRATLTDSAVRKTAWRLAQGHTISQVKVDKQSTWCSQWAMVFFLSRCLSVPFVFDLPALHFVVCNCCTVDVD